jgi:hypothetical protein
MTPKEKAIEIVSKFEETIYGFDVFDDDWVKCMNCALIAADEILNEYKSYNQSAIIYDDALIYWQEVKQEIENL